jgi:hypothetical protein
MTTSFYVEPPTIPEGMTLAEYQRARHSRRKRLRSRLLRWRRPTTVLAGQRAGAAGGTT